MKRTISITQQKAIGLYSTFSRKVFLFLFLVCCCCSKIMGVNYTVNTTADVATGSGTSGSLRYCITTANATAGSHTISFSGLAAGSTIALTAGVLPDIIRTMVIDATTTTGWTNNAIGVTVDATNNAGNWVFNVENIPGFEIYGFQIIGGANTNFGIRINGDNADGFKIGALNKRNVINRAGNTIVHVRSADNGFIQNNYLGCDVTGTFGYYGTPALTPPLSGTGLWLTDGANGNAIGGSTAGQGNLIAGGAGYGILLGTTGDPSPGLSGCSNNIIYGNRIGGTGTLGHYSCVGIYLDGNSDNNIIGGVNPGQANDLSYHQSTSGSSCDGAGGSAVRIRSAEAQGNTIRGNIMQCASSMGIRLQSTGSNNNQPSPTISAFNTTTNVLSGSVSSTPNAIIDVYLGTDCNGNYTTEIKGKQYLASTTADASGNWNIDLTSFICILNNQYVTATATHPTNNSTGQFANGFLINLSLPVINYAPGTYSVGPTGTFCSLQSVASFLNTYSISGAYVFELQSTYDANNELVPVVFNNNTGSSASNTVTIRPAAAVSTPIVLQGTTSDWSDPVTGSTDASALLIINGLDYFTLDGRSGGVGAARNLSLSNIGTWHSAISVTNNADYVTIRNCTLQSSMPRRTLAVVSIISNSTAQGCDFVTVLNNNISSNYIDGTSISGKYPRSGIYCKSTATTTGINNNITIKDNNIFDIKDPGVDGNGNCAANQGMGMIHFTANNNAFTVEGNSLYQTNSEWNDCGSNGPTNIYGIYVTSTASNNNIVRNNFIGGSGPLCAGTWTMPAMTAQIRFNAIHFAPTGNTATAGTYATITGNTIKNILWNTRSILVNTALAPAVFSGISVFGAGTGTRNVIIGTNGEGNTIGDNTSSGSITVTNTNTTANSNGMNIVGISVQGINSGTATIEYNNIGSITSSTSGIVSTIEGIRVNDSQNTVRFNTIGSTSVSNSFNISTATTDYLATAGNNRIQRVRGIVHAGGTATTSSSTIANNTIANLTVNYGANTSGTCGIAIENPTPANVRGAIQIQNNTINNIRYSQARSGTVGLNAAVASTTITGTGVGASVFTGDIATNLTLTVSAISSGSIVLGQIISGTNIPAGTFISAIGASTYGGVGTYTVALNLNIPSQTIIAGASNFTGSIIGNRLNITAINSGGNPAASTQLTGTGITNLRTTTTAPTFTTTAATSPNVAGIAVALATNTENVVTDISGNTIHSLRTNCWQAISTIDVVGIHYSGRTVGTQTINGNFIRDFISTNTSNTFESQSGILAAGGAATYSNNIIYLGNGITTHNILNGISETGGTNQYYFNTSTVGGTATAAGVNNTFAFITTVNTGTRNIRNNIFFNARSNSAGTSKHYAISLPGNTGLTINNNNYFANGIGGVLGRYNGTDNTTLATWQTSTGQDVNSQNTNPNFTANLLTGASSSTANNYRPTTTGIIAGASGTGITTDFVGSYRTCANALGAFELESGGNLLPNITITQPAALCGSGTVNLTTLTVTDANSTTGSLSYFSSLANAIAGTPALASPTAAGAGTYFIKKTSGCGYDIKPVTVTVNPLPTPTFTVSSSSLCAGATNVVFTTQTGMTGYTWGITGSGNSITSGTGTNSIQTTWGSNNGTVTINYTNANGCTAASAVSQAVTVTPLAAPTFTATGTNPACQGVTGQVFTTQSGRSNYLWSVVGGTITAGGAGTNSATITWNSAGARTVSVNYSNAASPLCFASTYTTANITVNAPTTITVQPTAPAVVCSGAGTQTISVTATGAGLNYSWRKGGVAVVNGGVYSGQGTSSLTLTNPTVTDAGSYDVVITSACPSVTSNAVTVSVNPSPQGSISGNTVCLGGQSQFTYTATTGTGPYSLIIGGTTYNNVASGTPFNGPSPSSTTPYTLTSITDANGCVRTTGITGASATLTVNTAPSITSQPSIPAATCNGSGTQTLTVAATGTGLTYSWRKGGVAVTNGGVFSGQGTNALTLTNPLVADAGSYDVVISGTCPSPVTSNAVTVSVNPLPQGSISGSTICLGNQDQFTFTATTGTGPYSLIIGGTTYNNVVSGTPFNGPSPSSTTSYTLTSITDANGCIRTTGFAGATATITVNTAPSIITQPAAPTATCTGTGTQTITVAATGTGLTYSWRKSGIALSNGGIFSGQGTNTLTLTNPLVADAGSYDVVISGTCTPSVTSNAVSVDVSATPIASAGGSQTICQNGTATVPSATATNGAILWTHNGSGQFADDGTGNPGATSTLLLPTYLAAAGDAGLTITLTITVTNAPCANATATHTVIVKATPTATAGGSASICQTGSHTLTGVTSANGTRLWTHNGAGSFGGNPTSTLLLPTYAAAAGDAGNTVTLTFTVSNAPCADAVATYTINVSASPTSIAGGSQTICENGSATVPSATANNGSILWTHDGSGQFADDGTGNPGATSNLLLPTYLAAAGDAGFTRTLTMTVSNAPCPNATATHSVVVKAIPTAFAGSNGSICQNGTFTVTGSSSSNGTRVWTHNGAGSFNGGNATSTLLAPTYTAAAGDAGNTVVLTLTVSNSPCSDAVSTTNVSVGSLPTAAVSGSAPHAISCGTGSVAVSGASAANNSSVSWSYSAAVGSSANGTLLNENTLTPTYVCDPTDFGTIILTMTAFATAPCATNATATFVINVKPRPTVAVTLGPNAICNDGNGVARKLTVSNSEANTTYLWSPATDLYIDAAYTIPYTNQNVTEVWSVPFVTTSYTVTATNNTSLCTTPASLPTTLTVCNNLTDVICGATDIAVNSTGAWTNITLIGSTASAGNPCAVVERDVYRRVQVPASGELHVTTAAGTNSTASLNIQRTLVSIHYAPGGTCTTSPSIACNSTGAAGNHSYVYATGLTPGEYAWIRIAKAKANLSDPNTVAQELRINVAPGLTWTGTASTAFTNASNWLNGDATSVTVPDASKSVLIRQVTNAPVVSSNEQIRGLIMSSGAGLSINTANTLSVSRYLQTANNTVGGLGWTVLNGSLAQTINTTVRFNNLRVNNAAGVNITAATRVGGLDLQQGVVTTNNNLTLLSDAALTGYVNNFSTGYTGSLSGNLNVERRVVLASATAGVDHYLASPVDMVGSVFSNYNDDLPVVGSPANYVYNSNPNFTQPSTFPSTWTWDETLTNSNTPGWIGAGGTTLAKGQGFSAKVTSTRIIDISGVANNGSINRTVTYTDNGLNLVGNPYPSPINFNSFATANTTTILPVLYIWNPASNSYASYNGSIWVNNPAGALASDVIGHSQSFFVFARPSVAPSGTVNFNNTMRTTSQAANFFSAPEGLIRLEVSSNGHTDEAVVMTNADATENYDEQVDAKKLLNAMNPNILAFTLSADNTPLAINALDKYSAEQIIPVQVIAPTASEVNIKLNLSDLKDKYENVYLEDATLGTFTDLKAKGSYTAAVSAGNSGSRFFLHFEKPSIAKSANELGVFAANSTVFVNIPSQSNGTIEVIDLVGKTIYTSNFSGKSGRVAFEIPNAVYGTYLVKLTSNGKAVNQKVLLTE